MGVGDASAGGGLLGLGALRKGATALRTTEIEVEAWGGRVRLRELTGAQRTEMIEDAIDLGKALMGVEGMPSGAEARRALEFAVKLIAATWVDGEGNPVIASTEDRDLLLQQPFGVLLDVAGEALRLSGMQPASVAEAKKNSTPTPTPGSGTN